ncbi:hypothetical protein VOLCADRAFT_108101 [Volvox carteri f. nagariensis]|uniref:Carboxypeptidase n=1 Tax=Volvox carteri f. nagariensis TaxID=3068 RepID=D8UI67_VOLCA|nr:uncharacterized protein VOLCADRAFT_108101 [Volvox carteri f. nagariensis]EFJ40593.1 hypothetical protein VOLCADRAFT_108101 [Volvox carteri f. nagariensis]|eukprot:XP_002958371.1 hypothetical protein VOLCADRAFT_108101 [Volvox carteri f. nagariensis]
MASPLLKSMLAFFLLISGTRAARFVTRAVEKAETPKRSNLTPDAAADKILSLPGFQNALPSNHFAGYVQVDEQRGRRLFYYFVESERDPANDPVVLWLNGGPGCSSFDGFVYEHGPFTFNLAVPGPSTTATATSDDAGGVAGGLHVELRSNPFAWNKVANMIFLDSPAGVGLSYSENAADYVVDDVRTAADADRFLRGWFRRFPQYLDNDFYVSGESYAGIYVPNLVRQVLLGNEAGEEPNINIVGYLVGNGCTDERYDGNAHPLFAAGKSLLPWRGFRELESECGGGEYWNRTHGSTCDKLWNKLEANLAALNVYDTLQDCFHDGVVDDRAARGAALRAAALARQDRAAAAAAAAARPQHTRHRQLSADGVGSFVGGRFRISEQLLDEAGLLGVWPLAGGVVRPGPVLNWAHVSAKLGVRLGITPPCTDSRLCDPGTARQQQVCRAAVQYRTVPYTAADLWLNDPRVREAIHAESREAIGYWTLCSDKISYFRDHGSMIPIHINNTKMHGLRALIYSGDHDMAVPHTGSEAWTGDLGFPVKTPWQPWFVADEQVCVCGMFVNESCVTVWYVEALTSD